MHYCSDVAKMIDSPILHVNGDHPEVREEREEEEEEEEIMALLRFFLTGRCPSHCYCTGLLAAFS